MLPGPTEIKECDYCQGHLKFETIISGNTFGSSSWSDGYVYYPMLPIEDEICKCPFCMQFLRVKTLISLGYENSSTAKPYIKLKESDYYDILDGQYAAYEELYLRTKAWHLSNDPYRYPRKFWHKAPAQRSGPAKENMKNLIHLLQDKDADEALIKAELFSELEEFANAIDILKKIYSR